MASGSAGPRLAAVKGPKSKPAALCYRVIARITSEALASLRPLVDIARIQSIFEHDCLKIRQKFPPVQHRFFGTNVPNHRP
jgi:hypothetical protein